MHVLRPIIWTLAVLIVVDIVLTTLTSYPAEPLGAEINSIQRYFNYGRSVESKVRWMAADRDANAHGLATTGWIEAEGEQAPVADSRYGVAFYGMSFSSLVGQALQKIEPEVSVRLRGGPAGSAGRSYADYLFDRDHYCAEAVVLAVLASSVPATATTTHMTWNFEGPGSHLYPRFYLDDQRLIRVDPPVNSLIEFRTAMNDTDRWSQLLDHLHEHDVFYDPFSFNADPLDYSTIGRLIRRSWAQKQRREIAARFYDGTAFTNHNRNLDLLMTIVAAFSADVRARGSFPVTLLFHDLGYKDHLYQALHRQLDELDVPYLSTHEIVSPFEFGNFQREGHFLPEYDEEIARQLLELITTHRGPVGDWSNGSCAAARVSPPAH